MREECIHILNEFGFSKESVLVGLGHGMVSPMDKYSKNLSSNSNINYSVMFYEVGKIFVVNVHDNIESSTFLNVEELLISLNKYFPEVVRKKKIDNLL